MLIPTTLLLSFLHTASALPSPLSPRQAPFEITLQSPWSAGATTQWQIHPSCNASERMQLQEGLDEAVQLAEHAKAHILRWGNESAIYRKYFGHAAPSHEVVGAFDVVVSGDRGRAVWRCDDPDGNCAAFPDWNGHWRGDNATDETVICPLSYISRQRLSQVCSQGYNVREGSRTLYWASDLIHRLYHLPAYGQGVIEHYAEGWEGVVMAAEADSPNATRDSDGLQYFALEVWAHDVVLPGVGCPGPQGNVEEDHDHSHASAAISSIALSAATSTSAANAPAATSEAPAAENCHTHSDGSLHCT